MTSVKNLKITVDLKNSSVVVFAGNTPGQAEAGLFQDDGNPTQDLIAEVLLKVLAAVRGTLPAVKLNIPDGKLIQRDLSFQLRDPGDTMALAFESSSIMVVGAAPAPTRRPAAKKAPSGATHETASAKTTHAAKPKHRPKKTGTAQGKKSTKSKRTE